MSFDGIEEWAVLPSPKLRRGDNTGLYAWSPFYTAFSERFAVAVIGLMKGNRRRPVILDPFVGGGTTVVASAILGLPAIGIDLDPFSALLSRAHIATKPDSDRVEALLASSSDSESGAFSQEANELFRPSDLRFAARVIERIQKKVPASREASVLVSLLDDPGGDFDSEVIALAALCIAGGTTAKVVRGSNPVWFRKALRGEVGRSTQLETVARASSRLMLQDLAVLARSVSHRFIRILPEDFGRTSLPSGCVDLVLTSPPYLNRLDYVVSHLGSLSILSGLIPISLDKLRREMMGTTKIVEKGVPPSCWGETCIGFLRAVLQHPSKASATYYYWNYYKYFKDLHLSLTNLKRLVKPHGSGVFVIQNSFYKDVPIATPQIVIEMASNLGIAATIVRRDIVRSHLGAMSPRQTHYVPRKRLEECVLTLNFG